jgi:hypothetical protein
MKEVFALSDFDLGKCFGWWDARGLRGLSKYVLERTCISLLLIVRREVSNYFSNETYNLRQFLHPSLCREAATSSIFTPFVLNEVVGQKLVIYDGVSKPCTPCSPRVAA